MIISAAFMLNELNRFTVSCYDLCGCQVQKGTDSMPGTDADADKAYSKLESHKLSTTYNDLHTRYQNIILLLKYSFEIHYPDHPLLL